MTPLNSTNKQLIKYLSNFTTEERLKTFEKNILNRTKYITILLEDIYQPHNASAVLRTCDCFGIQQIHIVENVNKYHINPDVALGSSKWLDLFKYDKNEFNTKEAIQSLKEKGYRIVATTPHKNDVNLEDFDLSKGKIALLFGTEMNGLTNAALEMSDEYLKIPMVGFTESLNISVSAAITIHHLTWKLHNSSINWQLNDTERENILLDWLKATIKDADGIIKEYYKRKS